jgi:hypothetical protein
MKTKIEFTATVTNEDKEKLFDLFRQKCAKCGKEKIETYRLVYRDDCGCEVKNEAWCKQCLCPLLSHDEKVKLGMKK